MLVGRRIKRELCKYYLKVPSGTKRCGTHEKENVWTKHCIEVSPNCNSSRPNAGSVARERPTVQLHAPERDIRFLTTHIPPGASDGWIKIETKQGIVENLLSNLGAEQNLCGDFNTPQSVSAELGVVTFNQRSTKGGKAVVRTKLRGGSAEDWDAAERSLSEDLKRHGIRDAFSDRNPNRFDAFSWSFKRNGKILRNRFDHVFVSDGFEVESCEFRNDQNHLSDHSPILAVFT